jgi:hypothetical protein
MFVKIQDFTINVNQIDYITPVYQSHNSSRNYYYFKIYLLKREHPIVIEIELKDMYTYIRERLNQCETAVAAEFIEKDKAGIYDLYKKNRHIACTNLLKNLQKHICPTMQTILEV